MRAIYLDGLNPAQLQAVKHDPKVPLQILAGPGSGKTKVLTSRIAYLISHHRIRPPAICAVTFTNKAANEMRERLTKLLGKEKTSAIKMGTFHALCAQFLRKYSNLVGLEGNFTVCDGDESKKIIKKLLASYKGKLDDLEITLQEGTVLSKISKAKAKGLKPADLLAELKPIPKTKGSTKGKEKAVEENRSDFIDRVSAEIYRDYQKQLAKNNSLDFDDLLVFGVRLFRDHIKVGKWCKHILVDEFQDTNTMQYELMVHIARANRCVTIVGDPDQSIYGWRSAEVKNLKNMTNDFPGTVQILLEQNYRSTGSILAASVAIVSQDRTRIPKTLRSTHQTGPRPFLRVIPTEESKFVAAEIKRLIAYSGGMLTWNDFVVLLRYNSLSRQFEKAFMNEGIPYRVLAGHKFFERAEVKDVLAYLQIVDNPQYLPAFTRCINVPTRSIGEKTVAEILSRATATNTSPLEALERIYDGKAPDIKPSVKRKIAPFIETIRELRKLALEGTLPAVLIGRLLELTEYREYLMKTQPDADNRWDNVQELINFATECTTSDTFKPTTALERGGDEGEWNDNMTDFDRDNADGSESGDIVETPLRIFLQATMLSTDTETQESDKKKEAVILSTCHAAKGLEWPVVFIPAVEKGVFPSARAEDIEEERRLLYVACTRAQGLLYLTYNKTRMVGGEVKAVDISEFVTQINVGTVFSSELPRLNADERKLLATVWQRSPPSDEEVKKRVEPYDRDCNHPLWQTNRLPRSSDYNAGYPEPWGNKASVMTTGFTSARESFQQQFSKFSNQGHLPSRAPLSPSRSSVLNTETPIHRSVGIAKPISIPPKAGRSQSVTSSSHGATPGDSGAPGSRTRPILMDGFTSSSPDVLQLPSTRPITSPVRDTSTGGADVIDLTGPSSPQPSDPPASRPNSRSRRRTTTARASPSSPMRHFFGKASSSAALSRSRETHAEFNGGPRSLVAHSSTSIHPTMLTSNLLPPPVPEPRYALHLRSSDSGTPSTVPADMIPTWAGPPAPSVSGGTSDAGVVAARPSGGKKRLGMGRTTVGYPNKKFKAPT